MWAERLGQSETERIRAEIAEALQRKASTMEFVYRIVRADGEERYLNASPRFLYAEDGTPLRMVGVTLDVTDQRRLEGELRENYWLTGRWHNDWLFGRLRGEGDAP